MVWLEGGKDLSFSDRGLQDRGALVQRLQRADGRRGGERIAAEGAAVVAGDQRGALRLREAGADGEPAGERLGGRDHVRLDAVMFVGPELARAAEAGLDLVDHEK